MLAEDFLRSSGTGVSFQHPKEVHLVVVIRARDLEIARAVARVVAFRTPDHADHCRIEF